MDWTQVFEALRSLGPAGIVGGAAWWYFHKVHTDHAVMIKELNDKHAEELKAMTERLLLLTQQQIETHESLGQSIGENTAAMAATAQGLRDVVERLHDVERAIDKLPGRPR